MMPWKLVYSPKARDDWKNLRRTGRDITLARIKTMLAQLERDPWHTPPPFKRLKADFEGLISRRITNQHRLVYRVIDEQRTIIVESLHNWWN